MFHSIILLIIIFDGDDVCRFLLENLVIVCLCVRVSVCGRVCVYVYVCVFMLLGGYSMPKRFYFVMIIM